jgi:hypothetical protein
MSDWTPVAILPNLFARKALEGEIIALASRRDPRVAAFCSAQPTFDELLSRFTNAFNIPLEPVVLIVRDDVVLRLAETQAFQSFRDLVAMCVIPYARSMNLVYNSSNRIVYSNSFWLYPWMLGKDNKHLVALTPAIAAHHVVEAFHGQSSPELPHMELTDLDEPLFDALLVRWKRHFLGTRQRWQDRALFRSLNMATQAAQLPAGLGTTLYDLGRMTALWVSAFEILAHPRMSNSGLRHVYPLLERVSYLDRNVGRKRYIAYMGGQKRPWPRRSLSCWLYGKLYQARCDFLHGNPIGTKPLNPSGSKVSLFWLAPSLYRLAVTGFLRLSTMPTLPKGASSQAIARHMKARSWFIDYQGITERALLRARK